MILIRLSARQKLQLFGSILSMVVLVLVIVAHISYDLNIEKNNLSEVLIQQTDVIGKGISDKLAISDQLKILEALNIYSASIVSSGVWVYSADGTLLAEYNPLQLKKFLTLESPTSQVIFKSDLAGVARNIYNGDRLVGHLIVVASTQTITYGAIMQVIVLLIVTLLSIISARLFTFESATDETNDYQTGIKIAGDLLRVVDDKEVKEKSKLYDLLTHLPNRTLFMTQVESVLFESSLHDKRYALILVSLNNFKVINNTYGHEVGDYLLQALAKRLIKCAGKNDVLARITGDEFAMLIERTAERRDLKQALQGILDLLSANFLIDEHDILIVSSIGVSLYPEDADNVHALLLHAAIALYHAKRSDRNVFKLYTKEMNAEVQSRQRTELLLRNAMTNSEFQLFYQPKMDVKTGAISGAEALLRWHNPELGWVPSTEFIRISEENGTIVPLGRWALKTACEQAKRWHDMGFHNLKIGVNISSHQFRTGDLVKEVAKILSDTNLPPNCLNLEITESVLMDNMERSSLRLKVLKAMGVTLSIDDFGTGYSSLSYLRRLPIDSLKIDQSFINHICSNAEDASIVKAIVVMSKSLKIDTVAEGVENQDQMDFLVQIGVDELQGFHFSYPLTAAAFSALLKESASKILSL
jgi:diguanylate cyclase (GGDEF)-like protein